MTTCISGSRLMTILPVAVISFSSIQRSQAAMDCGAVLTMDNQSPAHGASSYGRRSEERCEGTIREDQAGSVGVAILRLEVLPRVDLTLVKTVTITRTADIPKGASAIATILERTAQHFYRLDAALDKAKAVAWPLDDVAKPLGVSLTSLDLVGSDPRSGTTWTDDLFPHSSAPATVSWSLRTVRPRASDDAYSAGPKCICQRRPLRPIQ